MTSLTPLQQAILEEGLEDLIPLPEIALSVRADQLVTTHSAVPEISDALILLLEKGMIQVWAGPWPEEPEVLNEVSARELLLVEEQYEFNSSSDLARRVYYVNVQNLRVDEGAS